MSKSSCTRIAEHVALDLGVLSRRGVQVRQPGQDAGVDVRSGSTVECILEGVGFFFTYLQKREQDDPTNIGVAMGTLPTTK